MSNDQEVSGARRTWLHRAAGFAAGLPLVLCLGEAMASQNAAVRQALKYQATPNAGKQCSGCAQFVRGKTPTDPGSCTVISGDTEIAPTGWCVAWIEAKK